LPSSLRTINPAKGIERVTRQDGLGWMRRKDGKAFAAYLTTDDRSKDFDARLRTIFFITTPRCKKII
jgi:hypothetical protein